MLKQPQYDPFPVEEEVVSIWAGTNGHLDDVPIEDVSRFESEFLDSLKRNNPGILDAIRETRDLSEDTLTALKDAVEQFRRTFEKSNGELLVTDDEQPEALGEDEVGQEKVTRHTSAQPSEATGQDTSEPVAASDGGSSGNSGGSSGDGPVDANSPSGEKS